MRDRGWSALPLPRFRRCLSPSSASLGAAAPLPAQAEDPKLPSFEGAMDVEQIGLPPDRPSSLYSPEFPDEHMDDLSSFTFGSEIVTMGVSKAQLVDLASLHVAHCFRQQRVEASEEEIRQIAATQVELGGCDLVRSLAQRGSQREHPGLI